MELINHCPPQYLPKHLKYLLKSTKKKEEDDGEEDEKESDSDDGSKGKKMLSFVSNILPSIPSILFFSYTFLPFLSTIPKLLNNDDSISLIHENPYLRILSLHPICSCCLISSLWFVISFKIQHFQLFNISSWIQLILIISTSFTLGIVFDASFGPYMLSNILCLLFSKPYYEKKKMEEDENQKRLEELEDGEGEKEISLIPSFHPSFGRIFQVILIGCGYFMTIYFICSIMIQDLQFSDLFQIPHLSIPDKNIQESYLYHSKSNPVVLRPTSLSFISYYLCLMFPHYTLFLSSFLRWFSYLFVVGGGLLHMGIGYQHSYPPPYIIYCYLLMVCQLISTSSPSIQYSFFVCSLSPLFIPLVLQFGSFFPLSLLLILSPSLPLLLPHSVISLLSSQYHSNLTSNPNFLWFVNLGFVGGLILMTLDALKSYQLQTLLWIKGASSMKQKKLKHKRD